MAVSDPTPSALRGIPTVSGVVQVDPEHPAAASAAAAVGGQGPRAPLVSVASPTISCCPSADATIAAHEPCRLLRGGGGLSRRLTRFVGTHRVTSSSSRASWRPASRRTRTFQGQLFHRRRASAGSYAPKTHRLPVQAVEPRRNHSLIPFVRFHGAPQKARQSRWNWRRSWLTRPGHRPYRSATTSGLSPSIRSSRMRRSRSA